MEASGQRAGIVAIKAVHSAIFWLVLVALARLVWDGLRGKPGRGTAIAATVVGAESMIFLGNGARCPLTSAVERMGDPHGQITDIYLPKVVADSLPYWSGPLFVLGIVLNLRAWAKVKREEVPLPPRAGPHP